jgi:hypothetical protein
VADLIGAIPVSQQAPTVDNARVDVSLDGVGALSVVADKPLEGSAGSRGISLVITDVDGVKAMGPGLNMFQVSGESAGLVQELAGGFRVLRSIASRDASSSFDYQTNLPVDAELIPVADGFLISNGTSIFGALANPWAVDALGRPQQTNYTLRDGILSQSVALRADAAMPVVVDPNWTYAYTFTTRTSPNSNWIKLHNCFNCYFPIGGAPQSWPAPNELLPLIADGQNMECRMGTVIVGGLQDYSWSFRATANHIDGYGSSISFALRYVAGVPSLIVSAFIVNEPWMTREVMTTLAKASWQTFATNLGYK